VDSRASPAPRGTNSSPQVWQVLVTVCELAKVHFLVPLYFAILSRADLVNGSVPLWLVHENGYSPDAPIIGWTLSAFAFAGGLGSLVGGFLAPRLGPILTIVGAFLLALCPLLAVIASEPGTAVYFTAIALAGILIFVPVPALIIIAQEFVPGAPATASGMVLGLGSALAGIGYIVLGRVQEVVGLTTGILIGFSMVVPAALIALAVLLRARGATPVPAQ
jgi:FSR family fosmidomycin resistance protein-like MFS transporter